MNKPHNDMDGDAGSFLLPLPTAGSGGICANTDVRPALRIR
ncbi:MAG: hypothetical protein ACK560_00195 [Bacteroidota bacterium]